MYTNISKKTTVPHTIYTVDQLLGIFNYEHDYKSCHLDNADNSSVKLSSLDERIDYRVDMEENDPLLDLHHKQFIRPPKKGGGLVPITFAKVNIRQGKPKLETTK